MAAMATAFKSRTYVSKEKKTRFNPLTILKRDHLNLKTFVVHNFPTCLRSVTKAEIATAKTIGPQIKASWVTNSHKMAYAVVGVMIFSSKVLKHSTQ